MVLIESGLFNDINLIMKISALVMIISFVWQNLGKGMLSLIVIGVISYFTLFVTWGIFGSLYFIYILLMAGVSGLVIDFFFASHVYQQYAQEQAQKKDAGSQGGFAYKGETNSRELAERQKHMNENRQRFMPSSPRPPPPPM